MLSTVYHLTLNSWPEKANEVPRIGQQFWGGRDELSIEEDLLIKGDRICILPELYDRFLSNLHEAHQGIEKMQHMAKATVYWPGIDTDITEYAK